MEGGQDGLFICSCRGELPVALKKANQNETHRFFGDTHLHEQGQFRDEHSLNFIWKSLLLSLCIRGAQVTSPTWAGFTREQLGVATAWKACPH